MASTSPRDALRQVTVALASLAWSEADPADAASVLVELERAQVLLDATRLAAVRRLDEGLLMRAGWASVPDFLTHVAGGRSGHGRGVQRLSERLEAMPATGEAHASGDLATAKATVIAEQIHQIPRTSGLREQVEARLLEMAATATPADLARAVPGIVREIDSEFLETETRLDAQERAAHGARFLSFATDRLGGVRIKGYASPEDVELVKAALMPLSAPEPTEPCACRSVARRKPGQQTTCSAPECAGDGRDRRDFGARLWDGLVEACRRVMTAELSPATHRVPPRLTVTMDLASLQEGLAGRLSDGARINAASVRRLACDAQILPVVLGGQSEILDVGRSERLVTPGIWSALVARDEHCSFPGCRRLPLACDAHHLVHWADGGPTSLDNLALLCRRHHTITHHTAWSVVLDPVTRRPTWHPPPPLSADVLGERMTWIPAA